MQQPRISTLVCILAGLATMTGSLAGAQSDNFVSPADFLGGSISRTNDIQSVDLDGDGLADAALAVLSANDPALIRLNILLGVRRGSPSPFASVPLEPFTDDVRVGDVNGDGVPDIVSVVGSDIVVRLGHGDASFGAAQSTALGLAFTPQFLRLALADLGADGKTDVLIAHSAPGPGLIVAAGLGGGLFAPATAYPIPEAIATSAQRPLVADFDQDGVTDVLCPFVTSDPVVADILALLPGTGGGNLGAMQQLLAGQQVRTVVAARLDAGSSVDLAIGSSDGTTVFLNQGGAQFAAAGSVPLQSVFLQAADLDADGHVDLMSLAAAPPEAGSSVVQALLGDGAGALAPIGAAAVLDVDSLALGDSDGDGDIDVAFRDSDAVGVLPVGRDGSLAGPGGVPLADPWATTLADVNLDGHLDLVGAQGVDKTVVVLTGLGDGTFAPASVTPVANLPQAVAVADVDGDGAPDIVVRTSAQIGSLGAIELLHGVGNASFTTGAVYAPGIELSALAVADLDGDGVAEILTCSASDLLTLHVAAGGAFAAPQTTPAAGSPALVARDFDGDDVADVALFVNGGIGLAHGLGDGSFAPPVLVVPTAGLGFFSGLVSGHFDDDARADLATCDPGLPFSWDDKVLVALGHGNGTFAAPQVTKPGTKAFSLAASDVNGDGLDDLITAGLNTATVAVLPSLGTAGLAPPQEFGVAFGSSSVLAGDLNGDDRPDLVSAGIGVPLSVLLNQTQGQFAGLGGGTIGVHGIPRLTGAGALLGDDAVTVHLRNARPESPALLAVGLAALKAPVKGGVLLPAPDLVIGGLTTDAEGVLQLEGRWPAGLPSGLHVYLQAWVADATGPSGFAGSTSIVATTP